MKINKNTSSIRDNRNFESLKLAVNVKPKLDIKKEENTGELFLNVKKSKNKKIIRVLIDQNGRSLYPHNIFLNSLLKKGLDNVNTAALALLSFSRFLASIGKTYRDVTDDEEDSPAWLYVDYLLDNLHDIESMSGKFYSTESYSFNTAKTYTNIIVSFYKWLHRHGILPIDENHKSLAFEYQRISSFNNINYDDVLIHTKNKKTFITQTTSLKKRFTLKETMPPWMKLRPLKEKDLNILNCYLSKLKGEARTKALMLRLAIKVGLRVEELVTFPETKITYPLEQYETIPYTLNRLLNGCETKFDKSRTIYIPYDLMLELDEYKHSSKRARNLKKAGLILNKDGEQVLNNSENVNQPHGRLFVSSKGKPYSINTLQTFFSEVRKNINKEHPNWYYFLHCTRATFATEWLKKENLKRNVSYEFLINELSLMMGHSSTRTTQKYIDYMNNIEIWINHSGRKNDRVNRIIGNFLK